MKIDAQKQVQITEPKENAKTKYNCDKQQQQMRR
jgi:hypothetical protein